MTNTVNGAAVQQPTIKKRAAPAKYGAASAKTS